MVWAWHCCFFPGLRMLSWMLRAQCCLLPGTASPHLQAPSIECLPKEDGSFTNRVLWQFLNSAWLSGAAVFWRLAPGSENNASQLTYHPFPANHCHLTPTTHVSFDAKQNISLFERIPLPTPLSCMLHVTLHTYIEFRNSPGCLYFQDTVPVDMLVNRLLVRVIWLDKTAIALASQIFC